MSDTQAATAATGDPITAALAAGFAQFEAPAPIDNPAPEEEAEVAAEPIGDEATPADPEEPAEEPAAEEEPQAEDPAPEPEEEPVAEEADELKILTPEEVEAKFSRSNTKEARAYMAQVSTVARESQEKIAKLGGDEFIEPLAKMSTALQASEADPQALSDFFVGITEAGGAETLVNVLGQALYIGFVKADEWAANPDTAAFAGMIHGLVDANIQAKWGVDAERMSKMVEWEKVGWFDKLEEWVANNYVPQSELDEMLEINTNPTLKKLAQENLDLKRQKEKATPAAQDEPQAEQESAFNSFIAERLDPVLATHVWKGSPLQDISTDTPAMKETKAFLRGALETKVTAEFNSNPIRAKLLTDFQRGKQHTAIYKSDLAKAFDSTLRAVRPQTKLAEELLAKIYGTSRQTRTPLPASTPTPPAPLPPTVPQSQAPAEGPKTVNQVQKNLEEAFQAFG